MDWNAPMQALWSYFNGSNSQDQAPSVSVPQQLAQQAQIMMQGKAGLAALKNYKPIADKPTPGEATVKFYPTRNYLEPTDVNKGTPWAPYEMPVTSFAALANAEALARHHNIIDPETANYMLSGATREGRHDDYGVNKVDINYYSPPPKHLQGMIENSNQVAADINNLTKAEERAVKLGDLDSAARYRTKRSGLEADLTLLDSMILKDEKWVGTGPYKELTKKAELLGIPVSTNQELIRDPNTGKLITKVDRYLPQGTQEQKAKYVPLALANKIQELGGKAKGVDVYRAFIGGGKAANIRANQQEQMNDYITQHPKNKDSLYAYKKTMEANLKKYQNK